MQFEIKSYNAARGDIKQGDLIAFSGRGLISALVRLFTFSRVSHVGVVIESKLIVGGLGASGRMLSIIESTSLDGRVGVTVSKLRERVANYRGAVWHLRLDDFARTDLESNEQAFLDFLLHSRRKKYDYRQALALALRLKTREHFSRMFCSELVAGALEAGGVIAKINASTVTPVDLVELAIYRNRYTQFEGSAPTPIKRAGTVSIQDFVVRHR